MTLYIFINRLTLKNYNIMSNIASLYSAFYIECHWIRFGGEPDGAPRVTQKCKFLYSKKQVDMFCSCK